MDKESQKIFEALYDLHDRYDEDPKHMICADGAEQIKKLCEKIDTLKQQVPLPKVPKEGNGASKRKFIKCEDCKYCEPLKRECHNSKVIKTFPDEINRRGYRTVDTGDSCNRGEPRLYKDHDCAGCVHDGQESEACYECKRIAGDNYCCELKKEENNA